MNNYDDEMPKVIWHDDWSDPEALARALLAFLVARLITRKEE